MHFCHWLSCRNSCSTFKPVMQRSKVVVNWLRIARSVPARSSHYTPDFYLMVSICSHRLFWWFLVFLLLTSSTFIIDTYCTQSFFLLIQKASLFVSGLHKPLTQLTPPSSPPFPPFFQHTNGTLCMQFSCKLYFGTWGPVFFSYWEFLYLIAVWQTFVEAQTRSRFASCPRVLTLSSKKCKNNSFTDKLVWLLNWLSYPIESSDPHILRLLINWPSTKNWETILSTIVLTFACRQSSVDAKSTGLELILEKKNTSRRHVLLVWIFVNKTVSNLSDCLTVCLSECLTTTRSIIFFHFFLLFLVVSCHTFFTIVSLFSRPHPFSTLVFCSSSVGLCGQFPFSKSTF